MEIRTSLKLRDLRYKIDNVFKENPDGIAVAMSGGVDSSVLAAVVWSESVKLSLSAMAVIATSASLNPEALDRAKDVAKYIGIPLTEVNTREVELPGYLENGVGSQRCYHCRHETFTEFKSVVGEKKLVSGNHIDDLGQIRPGLKALSELEIISPFILAGIRKKEIVRIAELLKLPHAHVAPDACAGSRFEVGRAFTEQELIGVVNVEAEIRQILNLEESSPLRVRVLKSGDLRFEIYEQDRENALKNRDKILSVLKTIITDGSNVYFSSYKMGSGNAPQANASIL